MIEGSSVTVEYARGLKGLEKASFRIMDRAVTCLIGPNASGKSTLLRAIARITSYKGTILLDGQEVSRTPLAVLSRILSYSSPTLVSTSLSLKVREVLEMALYPLGAVDPGDAITGVSVELGVAGLLDRYVDELSSGELQRVILAAAFIKNPRYLLLDEPDAHVDVGFKPVLSRIIRRRTSSSTSIIATHDPIFASHTCDYILLLRKGAIIFSGRLEELLENPRLVEEAYGTAFTVASMPGGRRVLVPCY
ncbi:MAG: ABC transporter ATP-binding protein [Desulfurococcus sp.]|nr:ABC transporter ATP-binding protein [Desulfurococcus sp.]